MRESRVVEVSHCRAATERLMPRPALTVHTACVPTADGARLFVIVDTSGEWCMPHAHAAMPILPSITACCAPAVDPALPALVLCLQSC